MNHILNSIIKYQSIYDNLEAAKFPAKTVLLTAGDIAQKIYFIKEGAIRLWFNHDGKEITLQFFFEEQPIASIESLLQNSPSLFTIETIEPTTVLVCDKSQFFKALDESPTLKERFYELVFSRFSNYLHLFLSRIKDTPEERYHKLLCEHPEIIKRIPQHYIASYLGITSVSLSRIRNRR